MTYLDEPLALRRATSPTMILPNTPDPCVVELTNFHNPNIVPISNVRRPHSFDTALDSPRPRIANS